MLTQNMIKILEKQRLGFVATVSSDGHPNLSPKGTFIVIDAKTIAFGEIRSPQTLENLRVNPRVEVNIVDPLSRKGFRVKGNAQIAAKGTDLYKEHIAQFDRWGDLATHIQHIVLITIHETGELTSPAYDLGAQENDLRAQWAQILFAQD